MLICQIYSGSSYDAMEKDLGMSMFTSFDWSNLNLVAPFSRFFSNVTLLLDYLLLATGPWPAILIHENYYCKNCSMNTNTFRLWISIMFRVNVYFYFPKMRNFFDFVENKMKLELKATKMGVYNWVCVQVDDFPLGNVFLNFNLQNRKSLPCKYYEKMGLLLYFVGEISYKSEWGSLWSKTI